MKALCCLGKNKIANRDRNLNDSEERAKESTKTLIRGKTKKAPEVNIVKDSKDISSVNPATETNVDQVVDGRNYPLRVIASNPNEGGSEQSMQMRNINSTQYHTHQLQRVNELGSSPNLVTPFISNVRDNARNLHKHYSSTNVLKENNTINANAVDRDDLSYGSAYLPQYINGMQSTIVQRENQEERKAALVESASQQIIVNANLYQSNNSLNQVAPSQN